MSASPLPRRIAIACQGGGSHAAFTWGAMSVLLPAIAHSPRLDLAGFSGTSGGAICAALAWSGLVEKGCNRAGAALALARMADFWNRNKASQWWDVAGTLALMVTQRYREGVPIADVSPYRSPTAAWGKARLDVELAASVDFGKLDAQRRHREAAGDTLPKLFIGAANVLEGRFEVFPGEAALTADMLIASATLPTLFTATVVGDGLYWDGLFSQNPPIRHFIDDSAPPEEKPDELWIIQLSPRRIPREPVSLAEIDDRRIELAGNLSLDQEVRFIEAVNAWLASGHLDPGGRKGLPPRFKPIDVHRLVLDDASLDYASKLNRLPAFIEELRRSGEVAAGAFLRERGLVQPSSPLSGE